VSGETPLQGTVGLLDDVAVQPLSTQVLS